MRISIVLASLLLLLLSTNVFAATYLNYIALDGHSVAVEDHSSGGIDNESVKLNNLLEPAVTVKAQETNGEIKIISRYGAIVLHIPKDAKRSQWTGQDMKSFEGLHTRVISGKIILDGRPYTSIIEMMEVTSYC